MRPETQRAIAERARHQLGLISRPQLTELGVTPKVISRLERVQHLERLGIGVFRMAGTPRSWEQRVMAACLDTGGTASHRTAGRLHPLHGFDGLDVVEVSVDRARFHGPHPLAIVHTSTNLPADARRAHPLHGGGPHLPGSLGPGPRGADRTHPVRSRRRRP